MRSKLDVALIGEASKLSPLLLSIAHGNGYVVVQIDGPKGIDEMLEFIQSHGDAADTRCIEIGRFGSHPVTFCINSDNIAIIIDSDVSAGSFGQSAGIYIPRTLIDEFVGLLKETKEASPHSLRPRGSPKRDDGNPRANDLTEEQQKLFDQLVAAWIEASKRLGIQVCAPYSATWEKGVVEAAAFLPDFGSRQGMVVGAVFRTYPQTDRRLEDFAKSKRMFCSCLSVPGYEIYDEKKYKDALTDWGFFAPAENWPPWFGNEREQD